MEYDTPVCRKRVFGVVVFLFDGFHIMFSTDNGQHVLADFVGAVNELQKWRGSHTVWFWPDCPDFCSTSKRHDHVPGECPWRSCRATCHMVRRGAAVTEPLKNPQRRLSRDMTEATVTDTGQHRCFSQFYFRSTAPSEKNTGVGDLNQQARHHKKTPARHSLLPGLATRPTGKNGS